MFIEIEVVRVLSNTNEIVMMLREILDSKVCLKCQGRGYFYHHQPTHGTIYCDDCQGRGRVIVHDTGTTQDPPA